MKIDSKIQQELSISHPVSVTRHKHTDASTNRAPLWHEALEIKYFFSSGTKLVIGDELFQAHRGDIFVISPMMPHSTEDTNENNDYHLINIDTQWIPIIRGCNSDRQLAALRRGELVLPKRIPAGSKHDLQDAILHLVDEYTYGSDQLGLLGYTFLLLHQLLKLAVSVENQRLLPKDILSLNHRLSPALSLMHKEYSRKLDLKELAGACGIDKNYFCRLFMRRTGTTAMNYLNRIRIDNACVLLKSEDLTIEETAYRCGFNDSDYFSRVFRSFRNCSPRQYRLKEEERADSRGGDNA